MGGKDEASSMVKPRASSRQGISEATIAQLLSDFNGAGLLTHNLASNAATASSKQDAYNDVLSRMKHLHLKKPVSARQRLKHSKVRHMRANKLNLSMAAINAHKPVVWPAKLSGVTKKLDSSVLHPSRLRLGSKEKGSLGASVFKTSIHSTSSEEKARIEAAIANRDVPVFTRLLDPNTPTFSQFKAVESDLGQSVPQPQWAGQSCSSWASFKSFKRHGSGTNIPPAKHLGNHSASPDLLTFPSHRCNHSASPDLLTFSSHRCNLSSPSGPGLNSKAALEENHRSARQATCATGNSHSSSWTSVPSAHASVPSAHASGGRPSVSVQRTCSQELRAEDGPSVSVQRTCSQELRTEEANVNELASYFEDFLHIPRKMSSMAEMMYA